MKTRYKLTHQDMTTHNNTQWVIGKWQTADGSGDLCSSSWLHCYLSPLLAVLHNPIHANFLNPRLWKIEVRGKNKKDGQMKEGWTEMRLLKEMPLPKITTDQRIEYAIRCAMQVCDDKKLRLWAKKWLSGEDRPAAAEVAAEAAALAAGAASGAGRAAKKINLKKIAEKIITESKK